MVGCSIKNCKSRSLKGGTIRFFSFPAKESVANEWLRYCGPKTTTKNGRVCSNHFSSSDYLKSLQQILLNEGPKRVRNLKPDALPTLLIDDTSTNKNMLRMPIEENSQIVETSSNIKTFSECNTTPARIQIEENSQIEDTSSNNSCISECNTTPANEVPGSSKIVRKSHESITIPLAEYKQLKRSFNEYEVLKKNLEKVFTPGQIRCFMKPKKRRIRWVSEDIATAISLMRLISPNSYRHLRNTIGIPLPAFSTLRKWTSEFEFEEVPSDKLAPDDEDEDDDND